MKNFKICDLFTNCGVLNNFPFPIDDFDSLTQYEMLIKCIKHIKKLYENDSTLTNRIDALASYIENLDLQDEVNNKIDEMVESGQLQEIITEYLQINGMLTFNTVADMKNATNLIDGSSVTTLGFYNLKDNGGAVYKIRTVTNQDDVNEMDLISLNDENLVAELIISNTINVKQLGAKGNGTDDDTAFIQRAIDLSIDVNTILIPDGIYKITPTNTYHISGYGNYDPYYGIMINEKNNIDIICNGIIEPDFSEHFMNTFVLKSSNNININGFKSIYDGTQLNTSVTQMKSLFTINTCNNINIENCYGKNTGGLVLVIDSEDVIVNNCKSIRTDKDYKSPSFYGAYNSKNVTFDNCTCYGGTDDGDITLFGATTKDCKIINCYLDCRLEDGTLELNTYQGICVDSGCKNCIIDNNIVKFYYYGIDVKTNCEGIIVNANQCISNKFGISSRLGEGNDKTINTQITNNMVYPNAGNGNTLAIYDSIDTCGIYSQNTYGVTIDSNKVSCSTEYSHNFIPIFVTSSLPWNDTYKQPTNITNNTIYNSVGIGANFKNNNYCGIVIRGTSDTTYIYNVNCSNNTIKGSLTAGLTKYMIEGEYINHSKFDNNIFTTVITSSGGMKFTKISNSIISSNKFETSRINLEINTGTRLMIDNNFFKNSEEYYNTLKITGVELFTVQNNFYSSSSNESVAFALTDCNKGNVSNNTFITSLASGVSETTSTNITKENNVLLAR